MACAPCQLSAWATAVVRRSCGTCSSSARATTRASVSTSAAPTTSSRASRASRRSGRASRTLSTTPRCPGGSAPGAPTWSSRGRTPTKSNVETSSRAHRWRSTAESSRASRRRSTSTAVRAAAPTRSTQPPRVRPRFQRMLSRASAPRVAPGRLRDGQHASGRRDELRDRQRDLAARWRLR